MELECEKYKDKVDSENAVCRHPDDYCQFRQGCIIRFMEKERKGQQKAKASSLSGNSAKPQ
ncbi:MAG TPA: RNA polymerase II-associated protein [Desulfobulbus sp.]|nr:RNA polymerase II-associated protein [Desulfobulbus sp.]